MKKKNSQNDSVSVKINSFAIKNPHAHIQYVHSVSAKFEKPPLEKLLEELNTQTPYPKVKKRLPQLLSLKSRNSVTINSGSFKSPHAYLQYVYNVSSKYVEHLLKTV